MVGRVVRINDHGLTVGEDHHNAKLTNHEVDMLLELHEAGWGYGRLAKKFDISKSQARNICTGQKRCQTGVGFRTVHLP